MHISVLFPIILGKSQPSEPQITNVEVKSFYSKNKTCDKVFQRPYFKSNVNQYVKNT